MKHPEGLANFQWKLYSSRICCASSNETEIYLYNTSSRSDYAVRDLFSILVVHLIVSALTTPTALI